MSTGTLLQRFDNNDASSSQLIGIEDCALAWMCLTSTILVAIQKVALIVVPCASTRWKKFLWRNVIMYQNLCLDDDCCGLSQSVPVFNWFETLNVRHPSSIKRTVYNVPLNSLIQQNPHNTCGEVKFYITRLWCCGGTWSKLKHCNGYFHGYSFKVINHRAQNVFYGDFDVRHNYKNLHGFASR